MKKFEIVNQRINNILNMLINNDNLCKLIYYNESNPLQMPDIPDKNILLFSNIYPYPIPVNEQEQKSIITIALDDFEQLKNNFYFANNKLIFNILCHNSLWKVDAGLRPFMIMQEIDSMFNQNSYMAIGKVQFERAFFIYANQNYTGYKMTYKLLDFN